MNITMIGAGYVGLVSGACLADFGHTVTCVDKSPDRINALQNGMIPIFEPGLEELVKKNVTDGRLKFTIDLSKGVINADVVFIAVGTPSRRGDGHADLTFVYEATRDLARCVKTGTVIVTKSTVPVGTGDEINRILREIRPEANFSVASNPEFLREGAAIGDFKRPDRIVIGTEDEESRRVLSEVYRPLFLNQAPILFTDRRTSELIKYTANAFLAMKITFINEISDLCERVNANVQDVARGIGLDNRIGSKFLHPGPGFGGSCFPKDTQALVKTAQDSGVSLRIIESVITVNEQRKRAMARKVILACGGNIRDKDIAILGLAFKPNTDDIRDAPSLALISGLQDAGAKIRAFDPEAMNQAQNLLLGVKFEPDAYSCIDGAEALVILTEWDAFRALDLKRIKSIMATPVVVDLRNIYEPKIMKEHGFTYSSIGR